MDALVTLARAETSRGEVVLRRRGAGADAVEELVVNGAFAMDSSERSSERTLARLAYAGSRTGGRMLVGGLGLGYTAEEALTLAVGELVVVELEEALVRWAHDGITPVLGAVAADPRVRLLVGDVAQVLTSPGDPDQRWDAIALDVDNGPDFLIHAENAPLYAPGLLGVAYRRLNPGGRLAIWCQGPSPTLLDALRTTGGRAEAHVFPVARGERRFSYVIYTLDRPHTVEQT